MHRGRGGRRALVGKLDLEVLDLVLDLTQFVAHGVVGGKNAGGVVGVEVVRVLDEEVGDAVVAGLRLVREHPLPVDPPYSSVGRATHRTLTRASQSGVCHGGVVVVAVVTVTVGPIFATPRSRASENMVLESENTLSIIFYNGILVFSPIFLRRYPILL